jgi:hypothetical protein
MNILAPAGDTMAEQPIGDASGPRNLSIHTRSPDEHAEAGKALRDKVTRQQHAVWKPYDHRTDPIDILKASDLAHTPNTGIHVQACGDSHQMNFGGFATPERNIIFDINDFDETLPAPWEWDVKRLATSFVLAARANGLSDSKGRDAATICARSYRMHLRTYADMHPLDVWYGNVTDDDIIDMLPRSLRSTVRSSIAKVSAQPGSEMDCPKLAGMVGGKVGIRDTPPLVFHPEESRAPEFQQSLDQVFAFYRETLAEDRRVLLDKYRVIDAAIKVVGVGSVGRRCWIALMMSESDQPLFLQFKEAVASVLEPYAGASTYAHHGQRVVIGQRLMQPASDLFLGWVTADVSGKQFYVRQLRDAKIKPLVETFDDEMLEPYAEACGWVLARVHAKVGDAATTGGYLGGSDQFNGAMGVFALAYADQAERDHAALKVAIRKGRITAFQEA